MSGKDLRSLGKPSHSRLILRITLEALLILFLFGDGGGARGLNYRVPFSATGEIRSADSAYLSYLHTRQHRLRNDNNDRETRRIKSGLHIYRLM